MRVLIIIEKKIDPELIVHLTFFFTPHKIAEMLVKRALLMSQKKYEPGHEIMRSKLPALLDQLARSKSKVRLSIVNQLKNPAVG